MSNVEALREHLVIEEGLELTAYLEKKSQKMHIAYGHLLEQEQTPEELEVLDIEDDLDNWEGFTITQDQADRLLDVDINDAVESLAPSFTPESLEELNEARYIALLSMSFQLGGYGVQRFKSMVAAIQVQDWDRAADEMLWRDGLKKHRPSAWFSQTQVRCEASANAIRYGTFDVPPEVIPEKIFTEGLGSYSNDELLRELVKRIESGRLT